jgi:hypothetical protein
MGLDPTRGYSARMTENVGALGVIICVMSILIASLSDARSYRARLQILLAGAAMLLAFMGLGALFGKVLGDFLRNVNG